MRVDLSGLELQNHFAHQQLMPRGLHSAKQRQLAGLECAGVRGPIGLVLIVNARHVPEAGDAGRQ